MQEARKWALAFNDGLVNREQRISAKGKKHVILDGMQHKAEACIHLCCLSFQPTNRFISFAITCRTTSRDAVLIHRKRRSVENKL